MLKSIALVLAAAIAGVLFYATTRPDTLAVQRSATIAAPPDKVYALISDLPSWQRWSPWENRDPAMQRSFSGPPAGQGAVYAWQGNSDVGQGRMEITAATPPSQVVIKLDFIKPFASSNTVTFSLQAQGEGTQVTWAMQGASPYISKLMGVFVDFNQMIGKDFEAGLAKLKTVAGG